MAKPAPTLPSEDESGHPDDEIRDRVYRAVAQHVRDVTRGKVRVSPKLGRDVIWGATEIIFQTVLREGYYRFLTGYGAFRVQRLKQDPKPKRLPTGEVVPMPANRVRLRYEEGTILREALGMPKKSTFIRQYSRRSRLSKKVQEILGGPV